MPIAAPQTSHIEKSCSSRRGAVSGKRGFYPLSGKRLFDALVSAAGLVLLSPLFLSIAMLSKLFSSGPVFYRQDRVGKGGRTFSILKFRTMQVDADKVGPHITVEGDLRITRLGRLLRFCKLDELPQLWNVLKGDMSLVGPRPEVPCYVAGYTEGQRLVLRVRPGITDAASLAYRHEEQLLAHHPDPERYYRQVVLCDKLELNLAYLDQISFGHDLSLILRTVWSIFFSV